MVVATHGRSIWILDDLTPLHQLHDRLRGKSREARRRLGCGAVPAARRPCACGSPAATPASPRRRTSRAVRPGPAWSTTRAPAPASFACCRCRSPTAATKRSISTAGQNPPNGVVVHYYLPDPPPRDVTLTFLDGKGRELRRFEQGPRPAAGEGRHQPLSVEPPPARRAATCSPRTWSRSTATTGRWWCRVATPCGSRIGERSQTHAFDILPDPRIKTSAGDLEAQFVFLNAILRELVTVNATINEIDAMLEQAGEPRSPD